MLLIALVPTISQVALGTLDAHRDHGQALAGPPDAHATHGRHHAPETSATLPEDCWKACGYCDLFNHVPALDLPVGDLLVAAELPPAGIAAAADPAAGAFARRRAAQPRAPPSVPA